MSLTNPRNVVKVGEKWVASREVERSALPNLMVGAKAAKTQLDAIQDKLGTLNTPDAQWVGATPAQQAEYLRKAVVVMSEILEKQLKLLVFLAGEKEN